MTTAWQSERTTSEELDEHGCNKYLYPAALLSTLTVQAIISAVVMLSKQPRTAALDGVEEIREEQRGCMNSAEEPHVM
jgi:hypothetical protein